MRYGRSICSVILSGWSDNGWLSGGHAVRMAMELCEQKIYIQILATDGFNSNA